MQNVKCIFVFVTHIKLSSVDNNSPFYTITLKQEELQNSVKLLFGGNMPRDFPSVEAHW